MRNGLAINESGHLMIGGCDATQLARRFGTPLYVYDEEYIRAQCRAFLTAMREHAPGGAVAYAGKAFSTSAMLRIIEQEGLDLDVASGGELYVARHANFPMERVQMHGNNKSDAELKAGLGAGVGRFVLDLAEEAVRLNGFARDMGVRARVMLRVNPGVDAHTHAYIQTARVDSKFGVCIAGGEALEAVRAILRCENLDFTGLHMHLGSQIYNADAFVAGLMRALDFMQDLRGLGARCAELNMGGGYSVYYTQRDQPLAPGEAVRYLAESLREGARARGLDTPRLMIEPGRAIAAESCVMLYEVGAIKHIPGVRTYASVDGGLMDNPRPALYQAEYDMLLANRAGDERDELYTISGKACESDTLFTDVKLPRLRRGDLLAVFTCGAYQYAMASNYNKTPVPAVVLAKGGAAREIVRRQSFEDLVRNDVIPGDL